MTQAGGRGGISDPSRLAALHRTALLDTPSEEVFDRLARLARKILNTPVALVSLVDHDRQLFKSCIGLIEPWGSRRETPLSHSFCKHVVASGKPLVVPDARLHPVLKDNPAISDMAIVAYLGMPIIAEGHVLGSFCVIDDRPREWTDEDQEVLRDLASVLTREIELRMERKDAEQTRDWFQFLAEASVLLSSSLEYRETLAKIARLVVPRLADWCIVYAAEPNGSISRVALEHRDRIDPRFLERLGRFRLNPDAREGVAKVFRTGRPEFHPHATPELLAADVEDPAALADVLRPLDVSSWMCVPLWARGAVIGAISFVGDRRRRYTGEHLRFAEELVRRAALALDNARLYEELRRKGEVTA